MKRNPVAKFANRYNKSVVMKNRKRELKKTGELKNSSLQEYGENDEQRSGISRTEF